MPGKPTTNLGMLRYFCNPYALRYKPTKFQPYNLWYVYNAILGILGTGMLGKPPTNFGMLRYFCNPYVPRFDLTKFQPYNLWYIYNVILGILGGP